MTPARARRLSRRWFVTGIAALVVRTVLDAIGIDLLSLPLAVGMWLAFMCAVQHEGWVNGYTARSRALVHREDA